jgi:hypothetical protein
VRATPAVAEFDDRVDTRFHLDIYSEEWGYFFCHAGRASWIRITDIAFVHGRDDYNLLATTLPLADIGETLKALEQQHKIAFRREQALVRTNLANAELAVRRWLSTL